MSNATAIAFERFTAGDIAPFYDYVYRDMLLYAASLLPGALSLMAEDCVQNAVEKTYQRRLHFASQQQWKAFMMTCIRNNAISMMRSRQAGDNYMQYQETVGDLHEDLLLDYIRRETYTLLYDAIDGLPEDLRELLRLSFEEGLKNAEIAIRLGVAEITVKKRKARLISRLRASLGPSADLFLLLITLNP